MEVKDIGLLWKLLRTAVDAKDLHTSMKILEEIATQEANKIKRIEENA